MSHMALLNSIDRTNIFIAEKWWIIMCWLDYCILESIAHLLNWTKNIVFLK